MTHPIEEIERGNLRKEDFEFTVGDLVEVHYRIREGDKERIQVFTGTVIARKHGGIRETFTVRRIVAGEGVERVFPLHSPRIADIRVRRRGKVRRAKLYYLRDRVGKATRLKERRVGTGGKKSKKGSVAPEETAESASSAKGDSQENGGAQ